MEECKKTLEDLRLDEIQKFQYLKLDLEELIHGKSNKSLVQKRTELSQRLKSKAAADWFRERSEKPYQ